MAEGVNLAAKRYIISVEMPEDSSSVTQLTPQDVGSVSKNVVFTRSLNTNR